MTEELKKELREELRNSLEKSGYECSEKNSDGNQVLQILLDSLGDDEQGAAVLEIAFLSEEASKENESDEIFVTQFFVTFGFDIENEDILSLYRAVNVVNAETEIGSFFISEEDYMLVYKHSQTQKVDTKPAILDNIYPVIGWIMNMAEESYSSFRHLCKGEY